MVDLKNITNFQQGSLKSSGIFLLDYDSEVFIWVGKDVPKNDFHRVHGKAARAVRAINCKGRRRLQQITLAITFQGYEPEVFKSAFSKWDPFLRPGIDDN